MEPLFKRKKPDAHQFNQNCIICLQKCDEPQKHPEVAHWESFKNVAIEWSKTDGRFKEVFGRINWVSGANGHLWHKDCKWKMCNKRSLTQAQKKANTSIDEKEPKNIELDEKKISTRRSTGRIHETDRCIWCMKGYDGKHSESYLVLMEQLKTWQKFKVSVLHVREIELRERLRNFVDSTKQLQQMTKLTKQLYLAIIEIVLLSRRSLQREKRVQRLLITMISRTMD